MKYIFTLYDPITNITKEHIDNYDYKDINHMYYQWFEGNFSCDCNKRIFIYNTDTDTDYSCGDEVIILQIKEKNGKIIYTKDLK